MTSVIEVKHKWLWSVPDEKQVHAECLTSARRGRAADLIVIFTRCTLQNMYNDVHKHQTESELSTTQSHVPFMSQNNFQ